MSELNIYTIQSELQEIINRIEDNGGEVTEEDLKQLEITEANLRQKLDSYHKAIVNWESDMDSCKAEAKRLNEIAKVRNNRCDKLKKIMLDAVLQFGNAGKSNKYIELPDCRIFTRSSTSCEVDEDRCKDILHYFTIYINELIDNSVLYTEEDLDMVGIVDGMNALYKADHADEEVQPFTIKDLLTIKFNYSATATPYDLLKYYSKILNLAHDYPFNLNATVAIDKRDISEKLEFYSTNTDSLGEITFAKQSNNVSLQIK